MSPAPPDPASTTVVVVGAGPAGMAAAVQLAQAGVPVTVLDTSPTPGGQYHRTLAPGLARGRGATTSVWSRRPSSGSSSDPLVAAFTHHLAGGAIDLSSGTTIWTAAVEDGPTPFVLQLVGPGGTELAGAPTLRAASVVLATGATDRVLPFPGWDLPGVFTVGGAQALLKGQGVRAGRRMVVAGSGPFLLPVAAALAVAGTEVAAVAEAQPLTTITRFAPVGWRYRATLAEGAGYAASLLRHRVPFRDRTAVVAARGDGRVEEVTLGRLGPDWAPEPGQQRAVAVDAAAVSFGFVPQVGLAALLGCAIAPDPVWGDPAVTVDTHQATSVPGVYAAGEVTGVAGAAGAAAEGALAGLAAAHALGAIDVAALKEQGRVQRRDRARQRSFAAALGRMYERGDGWVAWLQDDTIVCRCEEVDHATVRRAIVDLAATDLRSVKLTTRCGMGMCQARMCGDAVATLVAHHRGEPPTDLGALSTPTVLVPVPLRRLASLATAGSQTTDDQHVLPLPPDV
jgi:D-hydroxyproline dehydrogenase subunit alpha